VSAGGRPHGDELKTVPALVKEVLMCVRNLMAQITLITANQNTRSDFGGIAARRSFYLCSKIQERRPALHRERVDSSASEHRHLSSDTLHKS
jgi:hypothetical protein